MNETKKMLIDALKEKGYEGLCNHDCGCTLDDLAPCAIDPTMCEPGYIWRCDNCTDKCEHHREGGFCILGSKKEYRRRQVKEFVNEEFDRFFEFPDEDTVVVTTTSAKIFAEHVYIKLKEIEEER